MGDRAARAAGSGRKVFASPPGGLNTVERASRTPDEDRVLPRRIGNMIVPDDVANKRRHGRLRCDGVRSSFGTILDVSASGLRLTCGRRGPGPGDVIEMFLTGSDRCVRFTAKCVWSKRTSLLRQEIGLEYVGMNDETRRSLMIIVREATSTEMMRPMCEMWTHEGR